MLSSQIGISRIQQDATFSTWVVDDTTADFLTVRTIHHDSSNRVCSEVDSERECHIFQVSKLILKHAGRRLANPVLGSKPNGETLFGKGIEWSGPSDRTPFLIYRA